MFKAVECFLTVESKKSGLHKDVVANEHAAKNGNASTSRFLSSKYPRLTKQSITEFKKAYNKGKQKGADLSERIVMKSRVGQLCFQKLL